MNNKKIVYRKKRYFDYEKNTKTSYYAIGYLDDIIIMSSTENLISRDLVSSIYHTFNNKYDYNKSFQELSNNDNYLITKHEFNRLLKEFKNDFKNNCFVAA